MQKVTGFGGFFFRSKDPKALANWYLTHLGIDLVPEDYDTPSWQQTSGPTVFSPFSEDTEYFGDPAKSFMLNFRVSDLDAMIAQLEANGVAATRDPNAYPNGQFARIHDPEGTPIELWEPAE